MQDVHFTKGRFVMIRVAACQLGATGTKEENLAKMVKAFHEAIENDPKLDIITFPEFMYFCPETAEQSAEVAVDVNEPNVFVDTWKSLAKEYNVNIITGSFVAKAEGGKTKNTVLVINRQGEIVDRYDKIHLMVAASFDESELVAYGDHVCVCDLDIGRIGVMVCYDLRFPELARSMCLKGAEMIFVSSAFPSGQPLPPRVDDWDVLVRSTALLNMTHVVACNQFGEIFPGEAPFGRSCVVDPKGIVTSMAGGRECIVYGTIDLDYQKKQQDNFGVWRNRRPELYDIH